MTWDAATLRIELAMHLGLIVFITKHASFKCDILFSLE